jgi:hypothetical protein
LRKEKHALLAVALVVGVLLPIHSRADQAGTAPTPDTARLSSERLDPFSPEVTAMYNKLHAPQTRAERMNTYGQLSSAMKSAVWIHHFRVALADHPEYTAEQRAVLEEAIALFTPDLFAITDANPEWSNRVDRPVQEFTRRAKAAFGVLVAAQLFAHLGPTLPVGTQTPGASFSAPATHPQGANLRTLHPRATDDLPQCDCSTTSDYCSWEYGSDWACVAGGCYWGMNWGCGTGEVYRCNGLCQLQYGGGG